MGRCSYMEHRQNEHEGVATTKHYYGQNTICIPLRPWVQGGRYKIDEGKRVFNLLLVLIILDLLIGNKSSRYACNNW